MDVVSTIAKVVQWGWKLYKAVGQLSDNDRRLEALARDLVTSIEELERLTRENRDQLGMAEQLQDLSALQKDLSHVCESIHEKICAQKGILKRTKSILSTDDVCREIERLHQRVSERYQRFMVVLNTQIYRCLAGVDRKVDAGFASLEEKLKSRRRSGSVTTKRNKSDIKHSDLPASENRRPSDDQLSVSDAISRGEGNRKQIDKLTRYEWQPSIDRSKATLSTQSTQSSTRSRDSSNTQGSLGTRSSPLSSPSSSRSSTTLISESSRRTQDRKRTPYADAASVSSSGKSTNTSSRATRTARGSDDIYDSTQYDTLSTLLFSLTSSRSSTPTLTSDSSRQAHDRGQTSVDITSVSSSGSGKDTNQSSQVSQTSRRSDDSYDSKRYSPVDRTSLRQPVALSPSEYPSIDRGDTSAWGPTTLTRPPPNNPLNPWCHQSLPPPNTNHSFQPPPPDILIDSRPAMRECPGLAWLDSIGAFPATPYPPPFFAAPRRVLGPLSFGSYGVLPPNSLGPAFLSSYT
ncbi:hypothetical protein JAAARDRAFT_80635 [Jaapia argillacea MUCL 33604]|uniref:Fungal N-terminal domain-containing protein n=1 Tax=Jaapia argillacea MUCL 33604 TaxID=933084 RepID=A0A067PF24_9AGAM|nr:hypothetical protein JAAARDRAFT_80635 [Jaapia argillacea MUCL 33604]